MWRITAATTGTVLVGRRSGASAVSSHSAVSRANAVKNASTVGSLTSRSMRHLAAYTIISRTGAAAESTRTRSS